jgi:hypothetical protein
VAMELVALVVVATVQAATEVEEKAAEG